MSNNTLTMFLVGCFFLTLSILIVSNAWCEGCMS